MYDLIVFYLLVSGIHVIPTLLITVSLLWGSPFRFLTNMVLDLPPLNRGLMGIGAARLERFFQLFDPHTLAYARRFFVLASGMQLTTVSCIILAIYYNVPFPFVSNINNLLPPGIMYELLKFTGVTSLIQFIPFLLLVLALAYDVPLPILPSPPVHPTPVAIQITRWERVSRQFASVRLTRFENFEKIIFYIKCRDDRSGTVFKLALCQAKEEGARTECYLYDDIDPSLDIINPAPISVDELEEIFSLDDY